jgi:hypothetical protein
MAQRGKQMRVGAREGFAYDSVTLVLVATCNRMGLIPIGIFPNKNIYFCAQNKEVS